MGNCSKEHRIKLNEVLTRIIMKQFIKSDDKHTHQMTTTHTIP